MNRIAQTGATTLVLLTAFASTGDACSRTRTSTSPASTNETKEKMNHDDLKLTQGTTADFGGSRFGLVDLDGQDKAKIDVWNSQATTWISHWRIQRGQMLPIGGQFLRILEIKHENPRAVLVLAAAEDTGGMAAPASNQLVLPAEGSLDVGATRIELLRSVDQSTASVRMWPKLYPLSSTAPENTQEIDLKVGQTVSIGSKQLRMERMQSEAGEIPGFVVFTLEP